MVNRILRLVIAGLITVGFFPALSGCGAGSLVVAQDIVEKEMPDQRFISKTTLEPDALLPIKIIALFNVPNPRYYLWGRPSETFAVDNAKQDSGDFNFSEIAQRTLKEHIEASGYRVIPAGVVRDNKYELLQDYSDINIPGVDAFLDFAPVQVGYKILAWRGPFTRKVGPNVSVVVRLISADSKKVLLAESIQYGLEKNLLVNGAKVESPPDYIFKNKEALNKQKGKAFGQLEQGIDAISRVIAERLSQ
jgi:hypothetical protein